MGAKTNAFAAYHPANYTNWGFGWAPRLEDVYAGVVLDYTNWGFGWAPRQETLF